MPQTMQGGLKTDWVDTHPRAYEVRTGFIVFRPGTSRNVLGSS